MLLDPHGRSRSHTSVFISIVVIAVGATARQAAAQSSVEGRLYAGAGLTIAVQPRESADGHYLIDSTLEGVSAGAHVTAGIHVSRKFSVGIELSLPAPVSGERFQLVGSGYTQETVEHRESIVSGLARWHLGSRRWRAEPAGGFSWVLANTLSTGELRSFDSLTPAIPTQSEESDTLVALTGGLDVSYLGLASERVAIGPFFRLHWVRRPQRPQETFTGLPAALYRAGVLVTARW